jgi:PAS domain S-box-containing protein
MAARLGLGVTIYRLEGDAPETLRLVYANAAADENTGFPFQQHVGQRLVDVLPEAFESPYTARYAEAARTGRRLDLGEIVYGDEHIERAVFDVSAVGLEDRHVAVVYRNVGRQAEAEDLLDVERAFLSAVLENAQAGIVACDAEGRLTLFNDAAKRFHGLAPDAGLDPSEWTDAYSLRRGDGSLLPPDEIPLRRAFLGETVEGYEMQIAPEGLPTRHLLASGRQLRSADGRLRGAVVVMHDVSAQREADAARREAVATADLRALADSIPQLVWITDPEGSHELYNARWYAYTGCSPDQSAGEGWNEVLHPADRERAFEVWRRSLESGAPYTIEYRFRRHDGAYHWFLGQALPRRNEEGEIVRWFGTCTDIHDRKAAERERREAEAALRASERQFRALIDNLPELAWTARADGYIDFYNQRWYDYTGTTLAEMQGNGWETVHRPDVLPEVVRRWTGSIETGEPFEMEFPLRGADGVYRWFLTRIRPLRDADGTVTRWIGINTNIDALRRTTAALEQARQDLASANQLLERRVAERTEELQTAYGTLDGVLNGTTDLIAAVDTELRAIAFNEGFAATFEAVYGRAVEEGMSIEEAFPEEAEERERARANWNRALAGEAFTEIQEDEYPGVGRRAFDLRYSPIRDGDGEVEGAVCVVRDVTEQREAEAALARYADELEERNAELQQFAYVASHDLQEPLRMVTSFLQLLERRYADQVDPAGREYIGYAVGGARRMQALLQDLLAYSRVGTHGRAFERVDLAQTVQEVQADLAVALAESGGRVEVGPLPTVKGDPVQLRQLLQNLIGNGLKFRAKGRPVVVQVRADRVEEAGRPLWRLAVSDNGIGLDAKYEDRVFQIFQRLHAREEYEGTGIGLAICKRIAERHGGTISYDGELGRGTTFYVTLDDGGRKTP